MNIWTVPLSDTTIIISIDEKQFEMNQTDMMQLRDKLNEEIKKLNGDWEITYG